MNQIAVYPGTFDPITNGHMDLIKRASVLFDELIVAIAPTHRKEPYFSLPDRQAMCINALSDFSCVRIAVCEGLLVDFTRKQGAKFIVRGLRAVSDFDYEFQLAGMNRALNAEIETIFLPATEENAYISATMLREIVHLGGDPAPFVPPAVIEILQKKK